MRFAELSWLCRCAAIAAAWTVMAQVAVADDGPPSAGQEPGSALAQDDDLVQAAAAETSKEVRTTSVDSQSAGPSAHDEPPILRVAQPRSPVEMRMLSPDRPADSSTAGSSNEPSTPAAAVRLINAAADKQSQEPTIETEAPVAKPSDPASASARETPPPNPIPDHSEADAEMPLKPIPDPENLGAADLEAASFNGVTPGTTTLDELRKQWGEPAKTADLDGKSVHLYRIDPFDQIEVAIEDKRVASIVVRLEAPVPADTVAQQLQLTNVRPVLISDDVGDVLGQTFPERGVMFAFEPSEEPGKTTMRVVSVILEPLSAESFVLRAETYLESQTQRSLEDLESAIELDPTNARAYWLQARVLAAMGQPLRGGMASDKAAQLDPGNADYRVTRAQILGQVGRYAEATEEAERALEDCEKRPHVKARTLCLLGDLASSGSEPDYKKAFDYHSQAIKAAGPHVNSRHPAVRIAAKKVLLEAHLGAANDLAWGFWDEKEKAVPRWLERAEAIVEEMIASERASTEPRLRMASRALSAYVGLEGRLDPTEWVQKVMREGENMITAEDHSPRKRQLQWDVGMALYDAVQIYQMRREHQSALKYGEKAIDYLEQGASLNPDGLADAYLLGRLYFRLGAIHSIGSDNHRAAITWFERAIPVFQQVRSKMSSEEKARLGETYVSMGVSYWNIGQREKAVELTDLGVQLIEKAIEDEAADQSALEVPHGNLATMRRELDQTEEPAKIVEQAKKENTRLK